MKLFGEWEAVRFPEENLILITRDGFLYYIYNPKRKHWRKHRNAGNDSITVKNYPDISRGELTEALGGVFPKTETAFMRCCDPSQLHIGDMAALLKEDYPRYMSDWDVYHTVYRFLSASDICHQSYLRLRELLDNALARPQSNTQVLVLIRKLCFAVIGRDIFKEEIGIVDGHNGSSYFWIMPVRVVDSANTNNLDNVAEMKSAEISIEETDVSRYLTPFLYKHFDDELEANQKRVEDYWIDDDGKEHAAYVSGFEWYLTHNFYTFEAIRRILSDIQDTMAALSSGRETEFTIKLKEKRGLATHELLYARDLSDEQVKAYNTRHKVVDREIALIIDFFRRFIYRMEYMLRVGEEKGYDLISFMGP